MDFPISSPGFSRLLRLLPAIALAAGCNPASEPFAEFEIVATNLSLSSMTTRPDHRVMGARGARLFLVKDDGDGVEEVHRFEDRVTGIHATAGGDLYVATDADHWDIEKHCRIYRSSDGGASFKRVFTLERGSALWWSITSDRGGAVYIGEYGAFGVDNAKRVWKSSDGGDTWKVVFHAGTESKQHIHRVAVDPITDHLWVSVGDGDNRGIYRSSDSGGSWQRMRDSQATAFAFAADAIYFGEDRKHRPGVTRMDRQSGRERQVLDLEKMGHYGGSIYDMILSGDGVVYFPTMKYQNQTHVASLWAGWGGRWQKVMEFSDEGNQAVNRETIAGPDPAGWLYVRGYRFRRLPDPAGSGQETFEQ